MPLADPNQDFPAWYQDVVKGAELAEPSFARGTMVIRPYGYAIWEAIQQGMDRRIKATGHQNLYFPLFFPYSLLEREADHVEGFSPQVAIVTHGGGKELDEPLVVRPTSEALIWGTYSNWIQSYRDLPLLYNQWANVVRWEMRTRLFLRTTEFLWQEGHTAHETSEEAWQETIMILKDVYRATVEEDMGMPVLLGRKSPSERFPGAVETTSIEALMRDGKALQSGTSHYFGQNFSKAYDVTFLGRDGKQEYCYSTSWGSSTRLVGGLIMTHGDGKGLRLPPKLAPYQVVIVPIYRNEDERSAVMQHVDKVSASLRDSNVRFHVDDRDQHRPGYKFNEWELKGVPVRLEIGPRDAEAGNCVSFRRDLGEKSSLRADSVGSAVVVMLEEIQKNLFDQAKRFRDERIFDPKSYDEARDLLTERSGFVRAPWCEGSSCEEKVKDETKATIRILPLEKEDPGGSCIVCGQKGTERATWAQSY